MSYDFFELDFIEHHFVEFVSANANNVMAKHFFFLKPLFFLTFFWFEIYQKQ